MASYTADDIQARMKNTKKAPATPVTVVPVKRQEGAGEEKFGDPKTAAVRAADDIAKDTREINSGALDTTADQRKLMIKERRERNERTHRRPHIVGLTPFFRFDAQRYSANQWTRPYLTAERAKTVQEDVRTTSFRYSILRSEATRFGEKKPMNHSGWFAQKVTRDAGPGSFNPKRTYKGSVNELNVKEPTKNSSSFGSTVPRDCNAWMPMGGRINPRRPI